MSSGELWRLFPIVLQAHNPSYCAWCNEEKVNLLRIFEPHTVRRISHIGSTSVSGLLAKPVVDILLEYGGAEDMAGLSHLLQSHGWTEMDCDAGNGILDLCKGLHLVGFWSGYFICILSQRAIGTNCISETICGSTLTLHGSMRS